MTVIFWSINKSNHLCLVKIRFYNSQVLVLSFNHMGWEFRSADFGANTLTHRASLLLLHLRKLSLRSFHPDTHAWELLWSASLQASMFEHLVPALWGCWGNCSFEDMGSSSLTWASRKVLCIWFCPTSCFLSVSMMWPAALYCHCHKLTGFSHLAFCTTMAGSSQLRANVNLDCWVLQ